VLSAFRRVLCPKNGCLAGSIGAAPCYPFRSIRLTAAAASKSSALAISISSTTLTRFDPLSILLIVLWSQPAGGQIPLGQFGPLPPLQ
jgi:hypothetical protein